MNTSSSTRADDVYRTLKGEIRSNRMPPEHQTPEPELALRLGVSRTTIREALIRLEAEGLIELIPRRGARILPIKADDMREIYEVLTALETEAAAALAQRRLGPQALAPLHDAMDRMQDALDRFDLDAWAKADDRFHLALLELHGNRRMTGFVQTLSDQAHRARIATLRLRNIPAQSTQEHRAILEAVASGDPEGARAAYRAHRRRAARELLDILEKLPQL